MPIILGGAFTTWLQWKCQQLVSLSLPSDSATVYMRSFPYSLSATTRNGLSSSNSHVWPKVGQEKNHWQKLRFPFGEPLIPVDTAREFFFFFFCWLITSFLRSRAHRSRSVAWLRPSGCEGDHKLGTSNISITDGFHHQFAACAHRLNLFFRSFRYSCHRNRFFQCKLILFQQPFLHYQISYHVLARFYLVFQSCDELVHGFRVFLCYLPKLMCLLNTTFSLGLQYCSKCSRTLSNFLPSPSGNCNV